MLRLMLSIEICEKCRKDVDLQRDDFATRKSFGGHRIFWHKDCSDPTGQKTAKNQVDFHKNLWPKGGTNDPGQGG